MEIAEKIAWNRKYKLLRVVRLKYQGECSRCKKMIPEGSQAAMDEGNVLCPDCLDFSIVPER